MMQTLFSASLRKARLCCFFAMLILTFLCGSYAVAVTVRALTEDDVSSLPTETVDKKAMTLSLEEAILLAVRTNPNVQTSQLSLVSQKFNLWIQQWAFYPHFAFETSATTGRTAGQPGEPYAISYGFNVQPTVSWESPIGTRASLTASNQISGNYNPGLSLEVKQPLLRGFGSAIVESALNNAKDSTVISHLNVENTLRNTITAVINAYLDVVAAEQQIKIDEGALKRAQKSVEQTKLYVKAGHKAGNEIVTVAANAASVKSRLEDDYNALARARYALLTAIGVDPNHHVRFTNLQLETLINKYHLPDFSTTKELVLHNDIQYQIGQITLHGQTKRNLRSAEDNTRWQLNLSANASTGHNSSSGRAAGLSSLFDGTNQIQGLSLSLQIPLDDQPAKQALLNAKIALKEAELALMKERWSVQTNAINGWNAVISAKRSLQFAKDAERLQEKTYNISYQKYLHGLIDSLALQSALVSWIDAQQALLHARINYLKALVNLDALTGNTLTTWHINLIPSPNAQRWERGRGEGLESNSAYNGE